MMAFRLTRLSSELASDSKVAQQTHGMKVFDIIQ